MKKLILALLLLGIIANATDFNTCAYTISSGGTYRLTSNLYCTGNGVTVNADSVIINLNGYTIDGDDGVSDRGILINAGMDNLLIENGSITDFGIGIANTNNDTYITIRNVSISSCYGTATPNGRAIRLVADTNDGYLQHVLIQNVTLFNNAYDGVYIGTATTPTPTINNITIRDSRSYSNGNNGQIYWSSPTSGEIINNTLHDAGGATTGIRIISQYVNITNNTIYNTTATGIFFNGGGGSSNIVGNSIHHTTYGIAIQQTDGDNILIENNSIYTGITPTGTAAIFINTGTDNNLVNNNNITDYYYGIWYDGSITAMGNNNITNNRIYNGQRGIYSTTAVNSTISGNTIINMSGTSVYLETASDNNVIDGNVITNSTSSAACIYVGSSSYINITNNNITTCTHDGIQLLSYSNYNRVIGNIIINSSYGGGMTYSGVGTDSDFNVVNDNVIGGGYDGITFNGDNNNATNNTVGNLSMRGISFTGSNHTITNNTVYNATWSGIRLAGTGGGFVLIGNFIYNTSTPIEQSASGTSSWFNTTMGYNATTGWMNLTNFSITGSLNLIDGNNVYIRPDFVALNTSALNSSAAIRLSTDGSCINKSIYSKSGLPTTASDIRTNGIPTGVNASCAGGIADFTVTGWSGYALDSPPATAIVLTSPSNGALLSGSGTNLQYNLTTYDPVTCNTTLDGTVVDSQSLAVSQLVNVSANASVGSHLWYVRCYYDANPAYYKTSATQSFSMSFSTYDYSVTLSPNLENVLDSPQTLFYDQDGYLNVLYFIDDATDNLHVAKISNGAAIQNYTQPLNATKPFFVVFRNESDTMILTFNTDNVTKHYITLSGSSITIQNASTTYNVTNNSKYDPYAYANTKNIETITNQTGSYYLFILPTTNVSRLIRMNYSTQTFEEINATSNHARNVTWGTIAANSNLTTWYYAWNNQSACNTTADVIQIWKYNGTDQIYNATPDTTCYSQGSIEGSQVSFEQYDNKTYALISNITSRTVVYLIEENKTYLINYTVSEPSPIFFIDEYTFVFFSREGSDTYAYSCYFADAANCTRYESSDYGAAVPYYYGAMTSAKRDGATDVEAVGKVTNWDSLKFLYSEKDYDTKFICYDEMDEYRKAFTVQIFTSNTSQILKNTSTYGYVLPSDMLGGGRKRAYFLCTDGTLRLFLIGLNNSFTLNSYSLDSDDGAYYTFLITNQYNQPVSNITITAQRFSNLEQSYVTIEQGVSDYTGSATLFLEQFALYQITLDANGYVPITFEFVPSGTTSVTIQLTTLNGTVVSLPNYNKVFDDVAYSFSPTNVSFTPPNLTMSYQVVSSNSTLEYYGMTVTRKYNGSLTTVYSSNVTTSPAGGLMNYTATGTGVYTVTTWFKASGYSEYRPIQRTYYVGNATGLAAAREQLIDEEPISGWLYYLIAVVAAMLVAGFMAQYTVEGAGIVGLIILWGFTWMYPAAEVVPELGITTMMATALTTMMVVAGVYVMRQGV